MRIGIFNTSYKENEKRLPIHPEDLMKLPSSVLKNLYLEVDYGNNFDIDSKHFKSMVKGVIERDELFKLCDLLILPKPVVSDLEKMREGQILFGWLHCVQQKNIAQIAIDKKLTLIAWEAMYHWSQSNEKLFHVFYRNNEIAGYAAVLHCLSLLGLNGNYGDQKSISIIGFGSVSRGAVYALKSLGYHNIQIFTKRPIHLIDNKIPNVEYLQYYTKNGQAYTINKGKKFKLIDELSKTDIIINGILQDPKNPIIFIYNNELQRLKNPSIIIDISCDENMGFEFAKPTTFEKPIIKLLNTYYYAVDHTPSYLWRSATKEISTALIPYLIDASKGLKSFYKNKTIINAIQIENGLVRNKDIIVFQNRKDKYPYNIISEG